MRACVLSLAFACVQGAQGSAVFPVLLHRQGHLGRPGPGRRPGGVGPHRQGACVQQRQAPDCLAAAMCWRAHCCLTPTQTPTQHPGRPCTSAGVGGACWRPAGVQVVVRGRPGRPADSTSHSFDDGSRTHLHTCDDVSSGSEAEGPPDFASMPIPTRTQLTGSLPGQHHCNSLADRLRDKPHSVACAPTVGELLVLPAPAAAAHAEPLATHNEGP
jgi:hypothetical protein